ncbi:SMI1/KNR4 family protein [Streptomyces sp. NPDC020917]|uniref:SMI1/KNR4 family protein n=1 Tax=Streptomyces sp. NPDC020917 TaxID=3365102 RepID=UPI00379266E7
MSSLERLTHLVAPPPAVAYDRPWEWTEERMGRRLPQEFKDLVATYGGGSFDDHLGLLVPPPARTGSEIAEYDDDRMNELHGLWAITGNRPVALGGDDRMLVAWADTVDADTVNWLVSPGRPADQWPVAVLDADLGECEVYAMGCTDFLAGLLSGAIASPILSPHLSTGPHTFRPYPLAA